MIQDRTNELVFALNELRQGFGDRAIIEALDEMGVKPSALPVVADAVRMVMGLIDDGKKTAPIDCLKIACGFSAEPYTRVAERHGVSKERIRQRVQKFRDVLNLPPCGAIMSNERKAAYALNGRKRAN